jgi:predicted DNA-binding transcriptional regulator AlpA
MDRHELMTLRQVAADARISLATLNRLRAAGTGPVELRFGRVVRVRRSDFDRWLDERAAPASA